MDPRSLNLANLKTGSLLVMGLKFRLREFDTLGTVQNISPEGSLVSGGHMRRGGSVGFRG